MLKVWLGVAALALVLHAQTAEIGLRLLDPHVYRERELVRVEVAGTGQGPEREWQFAGFLVDPVRECGTPAKPCFVPVPGLSPGEIGIGVPSDTRVLAVNHWVPQLTPGRYKVRALARRMVFERTGTGTIGRYAEPAEYRTSGEVEFEVVPSDAEWVRAKIAACLGTLRGAPRRSPAENDALVAAAQQLAWLDTAAARDAALSVLPLQESLVLAALGQSRAPAEVCDRMQARVALPEQSVSTGYLYSMTEVCAKAHLPAAPVPAGGSRPAEVRAVIATAPPRRATPAPPDPAMLAWLEKRRDYMEGLWDRSTAQLAASLPAKQPEPRWTAFATLLQRVEQVRVNRPPRPDPEWIPALTAEFVRTWPTVEVARQRYLLDMFASAIRSPDVAPLLERVLDSWKPGDYYEAVQSAVRSLNAIDPARAQARLRAELTRPQTWLGRTELEMLPPSAVPAMDDALVDALAAAQRPGGWNPNLRMAALARYGTRRALPRVKAIYESQEQSCQPELLAYFVRFDPAYADRVFHSHPWDMHAPPSPCTVQIFTRTAPLAMCPELERYMAAYLMHEDVYVKSTAAQALGRYGSSAALPALWDALRYFREWWKGKGAELAQNGQSVALEVALRNAIARGSGWVALPADLRLIAAACSSDWCRSETRADLIAWEGGAPRIALSRQPGIGSRVAQYGDLENPAAVEAKLAQFPRGTTFTFDGTGREADELRRFAAGHGLVFVK